MSLGNLKWACLCRLYLNDVGEIRYIALQYTGFALHRKS